LNDVYSQRLHLNEGVAIFVKTCQSAGLKTLLVSGGFTFFSDRVRQNLGLDFARANMLEIDNENCLTGRLHPQVWGEIVDGAEKRRTLLELCALMGIDPAQAIAVGDGANDLPMMQAVGVSVAFHAKPLVQEAATISITQGGMERTLEVLRPPATLHSSHKL
jgi:phosphoserine phosphatase